MKSYKSRTYDSKANFGLELCSKKTLIDLLELFSKLYINLDGFWYLSIKGEFGNDKALEHDIWVWEKMCKREVNGVTKALDIKKRDTLSFFKVFLMTPWFHQTKYEVSIINTNHCLLTINHCPTLLALESEGEGREETICKIVDVNYFRKFCKYFNPDLEISPVKLPPRKSQNEVCCQWEVKL